MEAPIEKLINLGALKHSDDLNHQLSFVLGCQYILNEIGLVDIQDPKKWVEEMKAVMFKVDIRSEFRSEDFVNLCIENEKLKEKIFNLKTTLTAFKKLNQNRNDK